jgi:hypothetical protein
MVISAVIGDDLTYIFMEQWNGVLERMLTNGKFPLRLCCGDMTVEVKKMFRAGNLMGQIRKWGKMMWKTTDIETHH